MTWQNVGTQPFPSSRSIYVDLSGNDLTGNGTSVFPFRTISKAISVAVTNTTLLQQTAIFIGAGNYTEANPITVSASGITPFWRHGSRGTMLSPLTPSQPFFILTGVTLNLVQLRLQATVPSSAPCFVITGTFNSTWQNCTFQFWQTVFTISGTSESNSLLTANKLSLLHKTTSSAITKHAPSSSMVRRLSDRRQTLHLPPVTTDS